MIVQCERCKRTVECKFYGSSGDIGGGLGDSGCWICEGCYYPFLAELDTAISKMKSFLEDEDEEGEQ